MNARVESRGRLYNRALMRRMLFLCSLALAAVVSAEPVRVIVTFHEPPAGSRPAAAAEPDPTLAQFREAVAALAGTAPPAPGQASPRIRREFTRLVHGAAVELRGSADVDAVAQLPYVAAVFRDREVEAFEHGIATPALAVSATGGGEGIVIAIIDSGVDYRHPALGGGFGPGRKVRGGWDFVNDDADPMDDHRHGTHVAGIAAGNSAEVQGIAPDATLLAYKVLGSNGKGLASDIIAAIERAVDPNEDGDFADRADVVNLSVGGPGHASDPLARAVDAAVAAGVVVCAAAGNDGFFHEIGSPASAASAITVGASDGTESVADFSSRGPGHGVDTIKPDVLAPGVGIRSAAIGGGTLVLSGTSMATPHVSGLAALLIEQHPSWSPERVKSAIVASAIPIAGEEAMTQGAGVVSAGTSQPGLVSVASPQLFFGLDATRDATWTSTRTLVVRNESDAAKTITPAFANSWPAVSLVAVPPTVVLAPGTTTEIAVTVTVNHASLGLPSTRSFAFDGAVTLEGAGLRLPWAFLRAGRVTVTHEIDFPEVYFSSPDARYLSAMPISRNAVEVLAEPARYDIAAISAEDGDVRVVVKEDLDINGDLHIHFNGADARNLVTLNATGDAGQEFPVDETAATFYRNFVRLLLPGGYSVELPPLARKSLHSSSFSDRFALLASESFLDSESRRAYVAQHPPVRALDGDRTLTIGGGAYASQKIRFRFPKDVGKRDLVLLTRDVTRRPAEVGRNPLGLMMEGVGEEWDGTLLMTPEVADGYGSGIALLGFTDHPAIQPPLTTTVSPMLRRDAAGFFVSRGYERVHPALRTGAATLSFGAGAVHPHFVATATPSLIFGELEFVGDRQESRRVERMTSRYKVTDAAGAVVSSGPILQGSFLATLPSAGAYRTEFVTDDYALEGRTGTVALDVGFDTSRGNATPPAFTSFQILDRWGRPAASLSGSGTLLFSVADFDEHRTYERISEGRTAVFFRRRGSSAWVQLSAVQVAEESGDQETLGRLPAGAIFRVDLTDALFREGEIELVVEVFDRDGNRATLHVTPAFVSVKHETRRRAARP